MKQKERINLGEVYVDDFDNYCQNYLVIKISPTGLVKLTHLKEVSRNPYVPAYNIEKLEEYYLKHSITN